MATSLGTIPEDAPLGSVYETPELAALPDMVYGMRPTFRELIWDADSGFAPEWAGRSSVTGSGPYVFVLGRSSFSAGGMAIFATTIVVESTGDVVGPAGSVDDRIATFDGATGKLLQDGGQTIAQVTAAAQAYTDAAGLATVYQGHSVSLVNIPGTTWTNFHTLTTWVDALQVGITRSGSSFTLSRTGYYRVTFNLNRYSVGAYYSARVRRSSTTLLAAATYGLSGTTNKSTTHVVLSGVIQATAADVITIQVIVSNNSATNQDTWDPSVALDGEPNRSGYLSIEYLGS